VIDKGTGRAIRSRYGITGDVAGKTGTTQDNTDGWFILMHPRVVAGAWVGFNDGRVTLRSDYWGQGAHSALPMVGDFVQQAFRSQVLDGKDRFIDEEDTSAAGNAMAGMRNWVMELFGRDAPGQPGQPPAGGSYPPPLPPGTLPPVIREPDPSDAPPQRGPTPPAEQMVLPPMPPAMPPPGSVPAPGSAQIPGAEVPP
jgi:penicillin-binding protein 1A